MEIVAQSLTELIVENIAPTLGAALIIMLVIAAITSRVRSRAVRDFGGWAGGLLWLAWLAVYYKVV